MTGDRSLSLRLEMTTDGQMVRSQLHMAQITSDVLRETLHKLEHYLDAVQDVPPDFVAELGIRWDRGSVVVAGEVVSFRWLPDD